MDKVIGKKILKVRQFLSSTRTHKKCPKTPKNWQTASNSHHPIPPPPDPGPLSASQLSWAWQWLPQDNPRHPVTISTWVNCKINPLWLRQWQFSAWSPLNPDLVQAPPGTDMIKLHEGLRKAESSFAIQLRMWRNGLDIFLFQARVPSMSSPLCICGRWWQIANHVLNFCPRHTWAWHELRHQIGHLPDSSKLLVTAEGLWKTIKWVMQRGILG